MLHLYFWVFFLLLAVAVGNVSYVFSPLFRGLILIQDAVVLSCTPFIAYFTGIARYVSQPVESTSRVTPDAYPPAYFLPQPGYMLSFVPQTWVCLWIPCYETRS